MTVLAVKNYKDRIEIATDSGGFYGNSGAKDENFQKLFEVNNIIFCSTGSCSESNQFELFCQNRKPEGNKRLDILRFFVEFRKWIISEFSKTFKDDKILENNYFFYYQEKLYHIWNNLDIYEIKEGEFDSNGAGFREAKTALYLNKSPREAVEVCIKINCWTAGKIQEKIIYKNKNKRNNE